MTDNATITVQDVDSVQELVVVPSSEGIPAEKSTAIVTQASSLAERIVQNPTDLALSDQVRNLGIQAETRAQQRLALLEGRISDNMSQLKKGEAPGIDQVIQIREKMDPLNPAKAFEPTPIDQFLSLVPFLKRIPAVRAARRYAMKYETYNESLQRSLNDYQEGAEDLLRDNGDIEKVMGGIQEDIVAIRSNAFLAESTLNALQEELKQATGNSDLQRALVKYIYQLSIKVRDLRETEAALELAYDSEATTRETNLATYDNMRRVIGPVRNILTVSILNTLALQKQREVQEATKYLQDLAGQMLADVAKQAGAQKVEIAKMQSNPIFAIEKIQEAYAAAEAATAEANRIILETIPKAQQDAQAFLQLSEATRSRREGIALPAGSALNSIEAQ